VSGTTDTATATDSAAVGPRDTGSSGATGTGRR
jgi:hypothetical protein